MKNRKSKKGQLASMLLLSSMVIGSTIVPIHAVSYAESIDKDMKTKIESSVKDNSNQTDVKVDLKENALKKAIKNVTKENAKSILDSLKARKDGILDKETADQFEKWLEDLVSYVNVSAEAKTKDEDKIKELAKVFDKLLENKDKLTVEDVKNTMKDFKIPMVNKDKPGKEVVPEEDQDDCGCNKILDESLVNKDKESEKDKEKETEKEESKVKEFKAIENKDIDKDLLKKANDALKASIESYNKAMKDSKFEEEHHLELNEYERSIRYLGYWATNANEKTASKLEEAIKINQAWFNYFDLEVKKAAEETKGITDADKEKDKDKKPEKDQDKETEKKPEIGDKVDQGTQTEEKDKEKDQEKDKEKDQEKDQNKDKEKDKEKDQDKDKEKEVIQPKVTIKDGKVIKSEITVEKTDDKKEDKKDNQTNTSTSTTTPSTSTTTQSTTTPSTSTSNTTQSTSTPSTSTTTQSTSTPSNTTQSTTNQSTATTTPQNVEKDIKINVKENGVMMYLFDITDMKGSSTLTGKALEEEMLKKAKAKDWNQETPMQTLTSSNKNGEDGVIEFKGKAGHIYYLKASKNNKVEVDDIVIVVPGTAYDNESANGKAPADNGKGTADNGKGTAPESMPQTGDDNKTAKIAAGIAGVGLASAGAYVAIKKKSEVKEEVSK